MHDTGPMQTRPLYENYRHASFNKLKIGFTHCSFKIKSACHERVIFSETRCNCAIFVSGFLQKHDSFEEEKYFSIQNLKVH